MKVILDIKSQRDWSLLLPLLERLNIAISYQENSKEGKEPQEELLEPAKNFDSEKVEELFKQMKALSAFKQIEDPVAWQKALRDEWN